MADHVTQILYGIFFADPVKGAAAQAANGGSLTRNIPPEAALAQYTPDAVILQLAPYFFTNTPGSFDAGAAYSPRQIPTANDLTVNSVPPGSTTLFTWSGTLIFATPSVPVPTITPDPQAITGKYEQQVVQWTGDGSSNRLIATSFPLDTGVIGIWVMGGAGVGHTDLNCFRSSAMSGTFLCGSTGLKSDGIVGFGSTGFVVTAGTLAGIPYANGAGLLYTAVVIRDTTSDNRYLRVGTYTGLGSFFLSMTATTVGGGRSNVSGVFIPDYNGLIFTNQSTLVDHQFFYLSPTTGYLVPTEGTLGTSNYHFSGDNRGVYLSGSITQDFTHLWIWGRGVAYRSTDFTGDSSVSIADEAYPTIDVIQGFVAHSADPANPLPPSMILGTQNNVNNLSTAYAYVAINLDVVLASQHLFASALGGASGGAASSVAGFGFTPGVAFGRRFIDDSVITGGIWRGPDHTGTDSSWCGRTTGTNDVPATGIRSIDVDGVTVGTEIAPAGGTFHAWGFKGGPTGGPGTVTVPFLPTYLPSGPPGQPAACPLTFTTPVATQPCADAAPIFP